MAESATITVESTIPAESMLKVKLSRIDSTWIENSRDGIGSQDELKELIENIRVHGQLQPVIGTFSDDGKMVKLVGGFRRVEALTQITLKKLVREYNDAKGMKAGDEGFIDLLEPTSRVKIGEDAEWKDRYQAALDACEVKVGTTIIIDETDAIIKNLSENTARSNLSTYELCKTIIRLIDKGLKHKTIGDKLGKSPGKISQCVKIAENPKYLREFFTVEIGKLKLPAEAVEKTRTIAVAAIAELERRTAMNTQNPLAIPFSHLRDFAYAVQQEGNALTFNATLSLLKDLVRLSDAGEITKIETMDYGVFKIKIAEAKASSKLPAATPETKVGDVVADAATMPTTATPSGVTVADLAKTQGTQIPTATNSPSPASVAISNDVAQDAALIDAENAEKSADDILASAPTSVPADGALPPASKGVSAETKTETKEAPVSLYKLMEPSNMEKMAATYLLGVVDPATSLAEAGNFLFGAMTIYDTLGCHVQTNNVNMVYGEYIEKLNKYLDTVVKFALSKATDAEKAELALLKPEVKTVSA